MYFFFDTETTGLSRLKDRIVQIAWVITDRFGHVIQEQSFIIKPDGFQIPVNASNIHGISTAIAHRTGVELLAALKKITNDLSPVSTIIGHNISFDLGVLRSDLKRVGLPCHLDNKTHICTMKLSSTWCRLPKLNGSAGFKWPTLEELHYRLFGEYFEGAHDALADVHATRRCFFELLKKNIIVLPNQPERTTRPMARERSFSLTKAVDLACEHCRANFSVTLNRYEIGARCPNCSGLVQACFHW